MHGAGGPDLAEDVEGVGAVEPHSERPAGPRLAGPVVVRAAAEPAHVGIGAKVPRSGLHPDAVVVASAGGPQVDHLTRARPEVEGAVGVEQHLQLASRAWVGGGGSVTAAAEPRELLLTAEVGDARLSTD